MVKSSKILIVKIAGFLAFLVAFKLAFYRNGKPNYSPNFDNNVLILTLIGVALIYLQSFKDFIGRLKITKISLTPIELEVASVENILGAASSKDEKREKLGLLALVNNAFEEIDKILIEKVNNVDDPHFLKLKGAAGVLPEKQIALVYLTYRDVRPELVSAFLQLRVKRLDLLQKSQTAKNFEIYSVIGLCQQILTELTSIGENEEPNTNSLG